MNKKFNLLVLLMLTLILFTSCSKDNPNLTDDESAVVAVVDDIEITSAEFDDYMDRDFYEEWVIDFNKNNKEEWQDLEQIEERFQTAVDEELEHIIRDKAAIIDAKNQGIEVSKDEIEETIEGDLEWYKARIGKDKRAKKRYNKNFDKNGEATEYNLERTKEKILLDKHWEHYVETLEVSDDEMRKELDEDRDFYIKMEIDIISSHDKSIIEEVYEEINKGKDITTFLSSKDLKVDNYGEETTLDYYREFLGDKLADELYEMDLGEISSIIEDDSKGSSIYYIVRINDKKDNLNQLRTEIKRSLAIERYENYLDKLVSEIDVDIDRENIKSLTEK